MAYINAYERTREYAGPEEGGRFYTEVTPIESLRVRGSVYGIKARRAFNAALIRHGLTPAGRPLESSEFGVPGLYRSSGQVDKLVVAVESRPAQAFNNWQAYS